jgi:hypothetical protein
MPVLARRRHEIGEPVEKLKRRELDNAVGPWPRGFSRATRASPVGGFVSRLRPRRQARRDVPVVSCMLVLMAIGTTLMATSLAAWMLRGSQYEPTLLSSGLPAGLAQSLSLTGSPIA